MKLGKIVPLNKDYDLRFFKVIIKEDYVDERTGELIVTHRVIIKLKNMKNGRSRIHPYTEFINKWFNKSTKYQSNIATCLVRFLNYIYFDLSSKVLSDISDLTFEFGVLFLNDVAKTCSREVVSQYERVIAHFYLFLCEKNLLNYIKKEEFRYIETNNRLVLQSPFEGKVKKAKIENTNNLHNLDFELIFPFIEIALKYEPSIALGIYFQIFGGLRASEVVSIEYNNISCKGPNGLHGMRINIFRKDLRPETTSGFISGVKRPRKQTIVAIDNALAELYKFHKEHFKVSGCNAVFVDRNGNPMTYNTYLRKFKKVKEAFIQELSQSENLNLRAYAITLRSYNWATHMGRGIFSNMVNEVANNVAEIAVMRGDKNLSSSLAYLNDSKQVEKKVVSLMEQFYNGLGVLLNDGE